MSFSAVAGRDAALALEEPPPRLTVRDVTKTFPGQVALDGVSLDLAPGRIHGLIGQNGSGKSTLIKILAGFHEPDPGSVALVDGTELRLGSALAAERAGMRFIHQDLGLVPTLSAVDNLALGHGFGSRFWVRLRSEADEARRILDEFGFQIDVEQPVGRLEPGARSAIAIARALRPRSGANPLSVLVLDEPTESLGRPETARLFQALRHIAAHGAALLYVSHRLEEVLEVTDEVTALRDGRVVGHAETSRLDHDALVRLIVGRSRESLAVGGPERRRESGPVRLRVTGLRGGRVEDASFEVGRGQIVGVAGITGSGREAVAPLLGCARARDGGELAVDGTTVTSATPRSAFAVGLVYVAADRQRESAIPALAVQENLTLPRIRTSGPLRWLSHGRERAEARRWLDRFEVEPPDPGRPLALLSGGNQQKVVLARALRLDPAVLVVDEPVQGVDIGARAAIFRLLLGAAAEGVAVVLVSSDFEDVADVCDRVLVMRAGKVVESLRRGQATPDRINEESLRVARPAMVEEVRDE